MYGEEGHSGLPTGRFSTLCTSSKELERKYVCLSFRHPRAAYGAHRLVGKTRVRNLPSGVAPQPHLIQRRYTLLDAAHREGQGPFCATPVHRNIHMCMYIYIYIYRNTWASGQSPKINRSEGLVSPRGARAPRVRQAATPRAVVLVHAIVGLDPVAVAVGEAPDHDDVWR